MWLSLRTSEWVLVSFFLYVALISRCFADRPNLHDQPFVLLAAVFALLSILARAEHTRLAPEIRVVRDWLPLGLTLTAFWEMEFFVPHRFEHHYEAIWVRWDHLFLDHWHVRGAIESFGIAIPSYLELCYLLVYGVGAYCIFVLYLQNRRERIDRFFTIYLAGTLLAYALFPYFPSQPPRLVFPNIDPPRVATWFRAANLYVLSKATIHAGVFPSAHVSSVFSATWALFVLLPKRKIFGWTLLAYAISVSLATIYGRYHYAADVLAGLGVSLIAAALCFVLRPLNGSPKTTVDAK